MILATPWSEVATPTQGASRVIGAVSNGCVSGADALAPVGPGYVSVRRYRNRYYGHPQLLDFIAHLGGAQQARDGRLVMIGDLSQPRGGRMPSSHRSHQNGLDVDVWLTLAGSDRAARQRMDHRDDAPSMVSPDGLSVNERWTEDQAFLVEFAARQPDVDRIFVNPAIKRALCEDADRDRAWLRKVRPWWGHDAHMHVRLACPDSSPLCEAQRPVPSSDGCGDELAWWFSEEVRHPKKRSGAARPEPQPPAACLRVLRD